MNAASRSATPDPVGDALASLVDGSPAAVVIDVGGGSGTRAVPLARLGCTVLVVDSSIDALAILGRRATDAGVADRIRAIQADAVSIGSVVPPGSADLVICHHLLETVDDPSAVIAGIVLALKPGGTVSVLVAGRFGAVLAQGVAGRYADAAAILADPDGRFGPADPLSRRFDITGLQLLLADGDLRVESVSGIGVVSGLIPGGVGYGAARTSPSRTVVRAGVARTGGTGPGTAGPSGTGPGAAGPGGTGPGAAGPGGTGPGGTGPGAGGLGGTGLGGSGQVGPGGGVAGADVQRPTGQFDESRLADLEADLSVHAWLREIATDLHAVARSKGA